jgi:predicted AlkP superfamily pyrophosphatase or phosphodiesterase
MTDILVELAKAVLQGENLGKDDAPDILSVSLSAIDFIYHRFGPYSWEMQDAMLKLDKSLGDLLSAAEKAAGGKNNLLVVLTSDHGGGAIPEEWAGAGLPGARLNPVLLQQGLSKELQSRFGFDPIAGLRPMDVYLNEKLIKEKGLDGPSIRRAAAAWLAGQPDIVYAVAKDDLFSSQSTVWQDVLRRGYYPERSGDVLFLARPFAVVFDGKAGADHGSPYTYDTDVPVIFFGKGVRRAVYHQTIKPTDVAPSVAALLEIGQPAMSEGAVRFEALSAGD